MRIQTLAIVIKSQSPSQVKSHITSPSAAHLCVGILLGLDWIMGWIGFDWIGLVCIGLEWNGLDARGTCRRFPVISLAAHVKVVWQAQQQPHLTDTFVSGGLLFASLALCCLLFALALPSFRFATCN